MDCSQNEGFKALKNDLNLILEHKFQDVLVIFSHFFLSTVLCVTQIVYEQCKETTQVFLSMLSYHSILVLVLHSFSFSYRISEKLMSLC